MHLGRLDVCRYRIGEVPQLGDVCSRCDVNALRVVVERWIRGSERWGQAAVHCRVDELGALGEHDLAEMVQAKTGLFHGVGHSHGLEVAAVMYLSGFTVHERVVGSGIAFDGEGLEGLDEVFDLRTDELGSGTEWVAILAKGAFVLFDGDFLFVSLGEGAAF